MMSMFRKSFLSFGGCILSAAAGIAQVSPSRISPQDQRSPVPSDSAQPANKLPERSMVRSFTVAIDQRTPAEAKAPAVRTLALSSEQGRTPFSDVIERAPLRTLMVPSLDRDRGLAKPMADDKANAMPAGPAAQGLTSDFTGRAELPPRTSIPGDRVSGPLK